MSTFSEDDKQPASKAKLNISANRTAVDPPASLTAPAKRPPETLACPRAAHTSRRRTFCDAPIWVR